MKTITHNIAGGMLIIITVSGCVNLGSVYGVDAQKIYDNCAYEVNTNGASYAKALIPFAGIPLSMSEDKKTFRECVERAGATWLP